jgi:RES domain-containing protein
MPFKYGYDYQRFATRVARAYRYRTNAEAEDFLTAFLATAASRISIINRGTRVWRAQLGAPEPTERALPDGSVIVEFPAYDRDRMKPPARWATEGRVNPKGIPVLYVATTAETAMSEVRPSLASQISLAEMEVCRDVRLVDCSVNLGRSFFTYAGAQVPPNEREGVVWHSIDDAFRKPVDLSDRSADYAPTQFLAECLRIEGYDGIQYQSGYGAGGNNVALFNPDDASVLSVALMRVQSIHLTFATGL